MLSPFFVCKGAFANTVKGCCDSCLISDKGLFFSNEVANDDDDEEQNEKKPFKRIPKRPS